MECLLKNEAKGFVMFDLLLNTPEAVQQGLGQVVIRLALVWAGKHQVETLTTESLCEMVDAAR